MAAPVLLEKPENPQAGAVTPGGKELGETRTIAAFLQAGAALLLPPSQQQHRLGVGGGKPAGRWDKEEGAVSSSSSSSRWILPRQNPSPCTSPGLGASLRSEARCAWQNLDLWVLHPGSDTTIPGDLLTSLNPVCHRGDRHHRNPSTVLTCRHRQVLQGKFSAGD